MFFRKQNLKIIVVIFLLALPLFASAAGLVPCGGDNEQACRLEDVFILIARVTNWLLSLAGVYAVYKIIQAGFNLAIAQGEEENITQNKKQITNAVVGFVLTLMAYLFMNTVVNFLLLRGIAQCKIDLTDPLNYVLVNQDACKAQHETNHQNDRK
jgi:hypothetical protein